MKSNNLFYFVLGLLIVIGFALRLYPGSNHLIWSYDQARDSVVIRSVFGEKNILLVGPQTEYVGLSHGPLYYYMLAPFYHLGQSNLNIPLFFMIFSNIATIVPLALLTQSMFKRKSTTLFVVLLFAFAYQQVEYARWLSNVSITIPFLAWFFYYMWQSVSRQTNLLLAGLFLGLAIQGEIFLLYLIPFCIVFFLNVKMPGKNSIRFFLGLLISLSSFILAELRFGFLATNTFITSFLGDQKIAAGSPSTALLGYLDHLGLTVYQSIGGLTPSMGLLLLGGGVLWLTLLYSSGELKKNIQAVSFLLFFFFSHSILFTFKYVDSVFLDISITIPLFILTAFLLHKLFFSRFTVLAVGILCFGVVTQLYQLYANTVHQTPMQSYKFHQGGILFSQKKEIVEQLYAMAENKPFTFGVLGTPYGVQTTWATIFEQLLAEHPMYQKPQWFGFQALGYPYDSYFAKTDHPGMPHFVIIEENILTLAGEYVVADYMKKLDATTQMELEKTMYGFRIQVRKPILK